MSRIRVVMVAGCLLMSGCGGDKTPPPKVGGATSPPPSSKGGGTQVGGTTSPNQTPKVRIQGLNAAERDQFYHVAEGSELYPLAWIKALNSSVTKQAFLKNIERFGLIPDPNNADGLAIGMTSHDSRGLSSVGTMVGINCAACHVGQMTYQGKTVRVDGAPNMFDLNGFYLELFQSAQDTATDPAALNAFFTRLAQQGNAALAQNSRALVAAFEKVAGADVAGAGDAEKSFAEKMQSLFKKVSDADHGSITLLGLGGDLDAARQAITGTFRDDVKGVLNTLEKADPKGLVGDLKLNADNLDLQGGLEELVIDIALLKARFVFLMKLKTLHDQDQTTKPGPGRIDAFVNVRDLVFPPADSLPANSPVSFPHLWQLNFTTWLHWDGNTNSVLERNIGQSMGLGAIYDAKTYSSTVLPLELHQLELLTRQLLPPAWPADVFGKVDAEKAARGKSIWDGRCAKCHASPTESDVAKREPINSLDEIGTDPNRVRNFAKPVGGKVFADALHETALAIKLQAYKDNNIPAAEQATLDVPNVQWRTNNGYVARPLVAIWATAPYSHNGSVPTLYDLLLPAPKRAQVAAKFPLGQREYDPAKLGYVTDPAKIPADQKGQFSLTFQYDTTVAGNSNAGHDGHDYGTDLSEDERMALLEYLKDPQAPDVYAGAAKSGS